MGMSIYMSIRRTWELFSAQLVFCITNAERRNKFPLRITVGLILLLGIAAACNVLFDAILRTFSEQLSWYLNFMISGGNLVNFTHYLSLDALSVITLALCFRLKADELLFRSLAGHAADMIKGVIFSFIDSVTIGTGGSDITQTWQIVVYGAIRFIAVLGIDIVIFLIVGRKWRSDDNVRIGGKTSSVLGYTFMILVIFATNNIASQLLYSLTTDAKYAGMIILALMCVFMLALLVFIRSTNRRRLEAEVIGRILRDRETQYAMSKENIDLINRKCHDLKHQIRALESASKEERESSIAELERSVMIYDSVMKTGDPVLDAILSEKMLYCQSRDIRMTVFMF